MEDIKFTITEEAPSLHEALGITEEQMTKITTEVDRIDAEISGKLQSTGEITLFNILMSFVNSNLTRNEFAFVLASAFFRDLMKSTQDNKVNDDLMSQLQNMMSQLAEQEGHTEDAEEIL